MIKALNCVSDGVVSLFAYSLANPWKFYIGYCIFGVAFVAAAHYISG